MMGRRNTKFSFPTPLALPLLIALLSLIGTLRSNNADGNKNVQKTISLISKTTTLQVHHAFLYISLPALHDYDVKMPNFAFYGVRKQPTTKFCSSFCTWIWSLGIQLQEVRLRLTKWVGRNNCDKNWKNGNSLFKRRSRCRRVLGS